jgi:TonB-dependent Receptor Plug Domain
MVTRAGRRPFGRLLPVGVAVLLLCPFAAVAADGVKPVPTEGAARRHVRSASPDSLAPPDSLAEPDSLATDADSLAAEEPAPPWFPSGTRRQLRSFRLGWSADREQIAFGDPADPEAPPGIQTLADLLRLSPAVRTRELSVGPTVESFGLDGGGSGRAELLYRGRSMAVPGTSGPFSHELHLTEVEGLTIVRGGAAALYGPDAVSGAVYVEPRHPVPDELLSRAVAEEGVDDYQLGAFHVARRIGSSASMFVSSESRRVSGFFPGTKEVDRNAAGSLIAGLPGGWEMVAGYRRYEGDGRSGLLGESSVLTKRGDYRAELFRPAGEGRGSLLEAGLLRERLETGVKTADVVTREIRSPWMRVTSDLPDWRGWQAATRAELGRWNTREEESGAEDEFVTAAGALRVHRGGDDGNVAATFRLDGQSHRKRAIQARLEGERSAGPGAAFAVLSRGERIPDRGAAGNDNEVHDAATVGYRLGVASLRMRGALFGSRIRHYRRDPTFEELRAREPVLDAPLGDAHLAGASVGFGTDSFAVPGVRFLGAFTLLSSVTFEEAELDDGGTRLPGRPRFTWTGEGVLERRFFKDELLAGVRGRLTHMADRVNDTGDPVVDLWLTDVLLEGRIGDASFFFRFHDMLQRADEVEPGYRFPGFSRTYGISWRFVG